MPTRRIHRAYTVGNVRRATERMPVTLPVRPVKPGVVDARSFIRTKIRFVPPVIVVIVQLAIWLKQAMMLANINGIVLPVQN